jgi:class 3 adenylate cyclase
MEERGNKTIMCSVLFLDIVEYSRKSVVGQISLKDRFNKYLSKAISDVPMTDRIILDTGDGAAINFLGDVEDALKAALSLRESLLNEEPGLDHPLLVRMGINLGPVRLVRDINGQPNIVGDGINVAQRVMGFADIAQILVSRSYYDAVSRLSPQYGGMFHYQGSRTDKHVREHEVYAIGYPGDKTTHRGAAMAAVTETGEGAFINTMQRARALWQLSTAKLGAWAGLALVRFRQAEAGERTLYVIAIVITLLLFIALLTNFAGHEVVPESARIAEQTVKTTQPSQAIAPVVAAVPDSGANSEMAVKSSPEIVKSVPADSKVSGKKIIAADSQSVSKSKAKKTVQSKNAKQTSNDKISNNLRQDKIAEPSNKTESQPKIINKNDIWNNAGVTVSSGNSNAYISVACIEGTEVFIDGIRKGRVGTSPLKILVTPGKHMMIVSNASKGIFTRSVEIGSGRTLQIRPNHCN